MSTFPFDLKKVPKYADCLNWITPEVKKIKMDVTIVQITVFLPFLQPIKNPKFQFLLV